MPTNVVRPIVLSLAVAAALIVPATSAQTRPTTRAATRPATRPAPPVRVERRPTTVPVNLGRARQELDRVRARADQARQQIARAAGSRAQAQREQGLAEWRTALNSYRPMAARLGDAVPAQQAILADYRALRADYAEAAGLGNLGSMFLAMQRRWSELTGPYADWASEPVEVDPDAPAANGKARGKPATEATTEPADPDRFLRRPKTLAFVRAADQYQRDVRRMPGYFAFDDAPEVTNDLAQARAAADEARRAYAEAARDAVDRIAADGPVDDAGREKLVVLVDRDLPDDVVDAETIARAEALIEARDVAAHGEARAAEIRRERAVRGLDERWAVLMARYGATKPLAHPQAAQRGELVTLSGFTDGLGGQFRSDHYDLAVEVGNVPVVMRFDPALKEQYKVAMRRAGLERLPAGTTYEVVARPVGTAKIEEMVAPGDLAVRAATQPSADNPEGRIEIKNLPASRPTISDAVVLDVIALRAGPIAVGVDPVP